MADYKGRFIIEHYNRQTAFSSFLPGISGTHGIPVWCFYVNRGQAVTSFGVENKNHSIMEFYPAHQAYQLTKTMGFRTFIKIDGHFYEPFHSDEAKTKMYVGMNELEIEERNAALGLQVNVLYYTLPGEALGGLVRRVTVRDFSGIAREIEMLDGMPAVIPYGIELKDLKEMAQTMMAWMQVEDVAEKLPFYRVRFSTKDSSEVSRVEGGNYMISVTGAGERLPVIVDPELVFSFDTSFERPVGFLNRDVVTLGKAVQNTQNQVPCGFSCRHGCLESGGKLCTYTVIGQAGNQEILHEFARSPLGAGYFEKKYREAAELAEDVCDGIKTRTADPVFDSYCKQTFLDNVLRGGYPVSFGKDRVFYVYSRKHGDIERDYNFFSMLPEYYSQGNGNYRDVSQNRRSDVLFAPFVKEHNIRTFYNLIQLDGYNPLSVKQVTYQLGQQAEALKLVEGPDRDKVTEFLDKEFSPGSLLTYLEKEKTGLLCGRDEFLEAVIQDSTEKLNADFGEGYWTDHWTYNLDLIESYLAVYPELEKKLLFGTRDYTYYESKAVVRPRKERYERTERGIRQYHAVDEEIKSGVTHSVVHTGYGRGEVYTSTLMTKLLVLAVNKMATLDMYGMGIEMEAGKPGWYDALNGLPGIFGSSMAETYELKRMFEFIRREFDRYGEPVSIPEELSAFMKGIQSALCEYGQHGKTRLWVWNQFNLAKEAYRETTAFGVSGEEISLTAQEVQTLLSLWQEYLEAGIRLAVARTEGLIPTYFTYRFRDYIQDGDNMMPVGLEAVDLSLFLEGAVRYMKLPLKREVKEELYHRIKNTGLYDEKLHMYKVNEPLDKADFEVGRAKAFSPGWLENESVWLHMEYKYLLELLKSGMYQEFYEDFHQAAVPFLDYGTYGRSLFENSSFIVSSANTDTKLHGKGFVARLSGSTAEFLQMWQIMMFGREPFVVENGELACRLTPAIPQYLIPEDKTIECVLLGKTKVIYHFSDRKDVIPGQYEIQKYRITYAAGGTETAGALGLTGERAHRLRCGEVKELEVTAVI